ncbi:hypothetical protein V8G54_028821 [Vigna mungo]|uniref:TLDc domain-containing protein n=1 Tax=Vigna mungo TaxID=3915 RepID=A0AAQ3RM16_VIGMU
MKENITKHIIFLYCKKDGDEDEASRKRSSSSQVSEELYEKHSTFISPQLNQFFDSCLPNITKGCQRILLYSSMKHGISLRTLLRNSAKLSGPALLIVGDREGAVFGGLVDCQNVYEYYESLQGTNQTFVFTTVYGQPRLFLPTGKVIYNKKTVLIN